MQRVTLKKIDIDENKILNDILKKYQNDEYFKEYYAKLRKNHPRTDVLDVIEIINNNRLCLNCRDLMECKQKIEGHYLNVVDDNLTYVPCKFQLERNALNKKYETLIFTTNHNLLLPKSQDLLMNPNRKEILLHIKSLLSNETKKGLYIYGAIGVGKTYILETLLNTYLERKVKCAYVMLNDLYNQLRPLNFSIINEDKDEFNRIISRLKNVSVLIIDDIGAERNEAILRDNVLYTILDYRMKNNMVTHFSSNYDYSALEDHFANSSATLKEEIKGKRIVERIKVLSKFYTLDKQESLRK